MALQQHPTFHALQSPHTLELWLPTSVLNALACWGCWRTSVLPGMGLAACKSMLMRGAVLLARQHVAQLNPFPPHLSVAHGGVGGGRAGALDQRAVAGSTAGGLVGSGLGCLIARGRRSIISIMHTAFTARLGANQSPPTHTHLGVAQGGIGGGRAGASPARSIFGSHTAEALQGAWQSAAAALNCGQLRDPRDRLPQAKRRAAHARCHFSLHPGPCTFVIGTPGPPAPTYSPPSLSAPPSAPRSTRTRFPSPAPHLLRAPHRPQ